MGTPLTKDEEQVLKLAAEGRTTKEIAAELGISAEMAKEHLTKAYRKLGDSRRPDPPTLPPAVSAALAIPHEQPKDAIGRRAPRTNRSGKGRSQAGQG